MTQFNSLELPYGATGIDTGDFAIEFRGEKVILFVKSVGFHYTLHCGSDSRRLDVHRTCEGAKGHNQHETLFAIPHDDIERLLTDLRPILVNFVQILRRLRLGWLKRRGIGIVWGLESPVDMDGIAAVTRRHRSRKRLTVDEEKLRDRIIVPEYLDDIWGFPDGPFSLFGGSHKIGVGFKTTGRSGQARLYWFKLRDIIRFFNNLQYPFFETISRYGIPPERHRDDYIGG